ncbi:UNVERIFIED_CONTAM: Retrovirus-related Pol polyprotein from transposon RE2 [Sesamum latifolium]|uniref:Retrovirus-related Pol polyprotein from transposon RE2 n=1 Tax=Sesamum latifolium TaxID=2727402 RepID=A0AAW2YD30_9LAMI
MSILFSLSWHYSSTFLHLFPQQNGMLSANINTCSPWPDLCYFRPPSQTSSGDCVLTATYLINCLPSRQLQWSTPYQLLHNKLPSYTNLRVLGCLCYATNTTPHKSKLDTRSFKCIFFGYPSGQKGYRLFNHDSQSYLVSRDVIFYEHVFPYSSHTSGSSSCPLPVIPVDEDCPSIPYASPNPSSVADADMSSLPSSPVPSPPPFVPVQPIRKSTRFTSKPPWLKDFVCSTIPDSVSPSLSHITSSYKYFVASLSNLQEPHHYKQAVLRAEWVEAMHQELLALEKNDTWEVVPLPPGKTAIGCKWVYKLKLKDDGSVDRCKAWLVAKGFNQVEGVDYVEVFSPVAKAVTVRLFLAIASAFSRPLQQLDINNAFLHGFLDEEIFMRPPEGYSVALGMDLGAAHFFLGLQIARSDAGLHLHQSKYIHDIISDAGLLEAKSVTTPFPLGLKLSQEAGAVLLDPEPYRRLVGRLLYLGFTRSDISYCVQQLSQFIHHPCEAHWRAALHVVRYLKGSPTMGLFFPSSSSFQLRAFCDADWASCSDSRRSLTGFCVFLGDALVSWKTKKQPTVSRSSAEAEYRSMGATVCELRWISYLLQDFALSVHTPVPLFCDNKAALHIMANPVFHERTKHLEINCYIVRDQYKLGFVAPSFVRGRDQLADVFTKSLSGPLFLSFLRKLPLFALPPSSPCGGSVKNTGIHVAEFDSDEDSIFDDAG